MHRCSFHLAITHVSRMVFEGLREAKNNTIFKINNNKIKKHIEMKKNYPKVLTNVLCAQKNRHIVTVLLST